MKSTYCLVHFTITEYKVVNQITPMQICIDLNITPNKQPSIAKYLIILKFVTAQFHKLHKVFKQHQHHPPDGPYHEDNRCYDSKCKSVGEVSVEGELNQVASQAKDTSGLHKSCENPEADG